MLAESGRKKKCTKVQDKFKQNKILMKEKYIFEENRPGI